MKVSLGKFSFFFFFLSTIRLFCPSVRQSVRASVRASVRPSVRPSVSPSVRFTEMYSEAWRQMLTVTDL